MVAPSPHKARWQYLFSHAILFSHVLLQVESGLKVYIMHNMHSCELIERRLRHKTVLGIGRFIRCYQSVLVNLIVGWFFRQKTIVVVYCSYLMVYSLSARWLHHTAKKPHKNKKKWKPRNQSGKQIVRFNKKKRATKKKTSVLGFWLRFLLPANLFQLNTLITPLESRHRVLAKYRKQPCTGNHTG